MGSNATLELALRDEPQAVMLTNAQLTVIANTEFVPKSMRGNVPKVLACIARGRAMGIPDMVAIGGIDIIEGKATLSAELMCAIVRRHGHSITGTVGPKQALVHGKRRDNGDTMDAVFTLEMAETAGLLNKANWKRHPDDMMWARAVSKLCRRLFADCFAGGTYTGEDFGEAEELTYDEVTDDEPIAPPDPVEVPESSPWQQLQARLAEHNIARDNRFQAAARQIVPEGAPDQITADQAEQIWQAVRPQDAQETLL